MIARRQFISLLGGAAAAWPVRVRGQQPAMPVIGFISSRSYADSEASVTAFRRAMTEAGFVEGQNLTIEFRWAEGKLERLPEMAADLVRRSVKVIFAGGGNDPVQAVAAATSSIPIVFTSSTDPVESGLVQSLNRPGGNITGVSVVGAALEVKRLGVLREVAPAAKRIGLMVNPRYAAAPTQTRDLAEAAATLKQETILVHASSDDEMLAAFATLARHQADALLVATDVFFLNRRSQLVALAARHLIPAMYTFREYAQSGGLMSYGPSLPEAYRQAGLYVARILKGAQPADLPVVQPTKFELVINLTTAKALGLTVPDKLLALADEVIE